MRAWRVPSHYFRHASPRFRFASSRCGRAPYASNYKKMLTCEHDASFYNYWRMAFLIQKPPLRAAVLPGSGGLCFTYLGKGKSYLKSDCSLKMYISYNINVSKICTFSNIFIKFIKNGLESFIFQHSLTVSIVFTPIFTPIHKINQKKAAVIKPPPR